MQWDELNFFAGGTIRIFLDDYEVGEPQAELVRGDGNGRLGRGVGDLRQAH